MARSDSVTAWFAGPKAENGEDFIRLVDRILRDYHAWRRNYFPEDGVVLDSAQRRVNEPFFDDFEDRLNELLGQLKADFPFQSPRYAGHMIAEQTMPGIAGWFAGMLYNPNNVTAEVAPVTVRLELEAAGLIAEMLGYEKDYWAHLTSGGTIANIEALWVARTVALLPLTVRQMRSGLDLSDERTELRIGMSPSASLEAFRRCFEDANADFGTSDATDRRLIRAFLDSEFNPAERGMASVAARANWHPIILAPETHHYCLLKAMDVLGLGREALRRVRVDKDFRMDVAALSEALDEAERAGEHVLSVVAVAGTTEEGAVDPIDAIVRIRQDREAAGRPSFWLHVDAAYGGYLRTISRPDRAGLGEPMAQARINGKEVDLPIHLPDAGVCDALICLHEADSIVVDPHKLGYLPYPIGAVCFRSNLVKPLARQDAPYLEDSPSGVESERTSDRIGVYILEGSKPGAAAAAVWLSHQLIPLTRFGHGQLVRETVRNASEMAALLTRLPELVEGHTVRAECLCQPGSNIVCFAFRPSLDGPGLAALNRLNQAIYSKFTVVPGGTSRVYDQKFFVSHTTLKAAQYAPSTVEDFLSRLGVDPLEYEREGVFLLRSVLMNPWYGQAKTRGRFYVSELVEELYAAANRLAQ